MNEQGQSPLQPMSSRMSESARLTGISRRFLLGAGAAAGIPTASGQTGSLADSIADRRRGIVSMEDWPRRLGETSDSARFQRAWDDLHAGATAPSAPDYVPGTPLPFEWQMKKLVLTEPRYIFDNSVTPFYNIEASGVTALVASSNRVDIFDMTDPALNFSHVRFRGLTFVGGRHHVLLNNPNTDGAQIDFDFCRFAGSGDYAILQGGTENPEVAPFGRSTVINLNYSSCIRCNGLIRYKADILNAFAGWHQPHYENYSADRAWIKMDRVTGENGNPNYSYLQVANLKAFCGAPNMHDGIAFTAGARWVDVRGSLDCDAACRLGGEEAGMAVAYYDGVPQIVAPFRPHKIKIGGGQAAAGPTSVGRSAVVHCVRSIPEVIDVNATDGPYDVDIVNFDARLVAETVWANWKADCAAGSGQGYMATADIRNFWRWSIAMGGSRVLNSMVNPWPIDVGHIVAADLARQRLTPQQFGGVGDGIANDTVALQAVLDRAILLGGRIHIPTGKYKTTAAMVIDLTGVTADTDITRVHIEGDGDGNTQILCGHTGHGIDYRGSSAVGVYFKLASLRILGNGTGNAGLKADNIGWFHIEDVTINGGFDYGVDATDILSGSFENCRLRGNERGFRFAFSDVSRPNAVSMRDVNVGVNSIYGGLVTGATTFTMSGGAVEGNGSWGGWGIKAVDCGVEGAVGLVIDGVYFEGNYDKADLWITHASGDAMHSVKGSTFNRLSASNYATNNILFERSGGAARLWLGGNGFKGFSAYTEDASRRYLVAPVNAVIDVGNYYHSGTAFPASNQTRGPWSGAVAADGSAITLPKGWSCAKNSTGNYTVTHSMGSATAYIVVATTNFSTAVIVQRVLRAANAFEVVTTNAVGVATNAAFDFVVMFNGAAGL